MFCVLSCYISYVEARSFKLTKTIAQSKHVQNESRINNELKYSDVIYKL